MEQKFGKITVETCEADGVEIEGLKVITPSVFGDDRGYFMETYNYNDLQRQALIVHLYRITSPALRKVCFEDCISRSIIHRISLCVL